MADKIHVLFLHSQSGYGADSAIHGDLMRHLDRDRYVVHLACAAGDGPGESPALKAFRKIPDVHIRPTHFAPGFRHRSRDEVLRQFRAAVSFPLEFVALQAYVLRKGIKLIHGTDRPRDAAYAVTLGKLTGAKSIVHVHVAWSNGYSAPATWGVRTASGVFSISRFVTGTIIATGTPAARVHTVLNGIDPSPWDPSIDGSGIRREFGIPAQAPLLASVSRLFANKGQRELLQAFARVLGEVPDAWLLVVGADAVEVHRGSFTAELKVLARELGVSERVVFTGSRSDVPRVMAACDVFTMPSWEEPFGLVFLEAMAMQRPVVSLNDGGTPEVVEHGRSGLLSAHGDIGTMTANIVSLLKDKALRDRMGAYGRARVLDYFTAARMARDAAVEYEAMLGGTPPSFARTRSGVTS
jgi:glycosyltransferase involved in cell wall biosynthesis